MRLDLSTLPSVQYVELIGILGDLQKMSTGEGRDQVLAKVHERAGGGPSWSKSIKREKDSQSDLMAIWDAASQQNRTGELLRAIEIFESGEPFEKLKQVVASCTEAVKRNQPLNAAMPDLLEHLGDPSDEAIAFWLGRLRSARPGIPERANHILRDLLLLLGELPAMQADNSFSFPLFVFVDGLAGDKLEPCERAKLGALLAALADGYGLTQAGQVALRMSVASMRRTTMTPASADPVEPSILVVIKPDLKLTVPPHYFVEVFDWHPWESADVAEEMGSSGRAIEKTTVFPLSLTSVMMFSDDIRAAIGREVGRRLLRVGTRAPMVEFLVPGCLICEDYEGIEVRLVPAVDLTVPLGTRARVVVRSLERWQPCFREDPWPVEVWQKRWRGFAQRNSPWPCRWDDHLDDLEAAAIFLLHPDNEDSGLLALGHAPIDGAIADAVHALLVATGVPVAIWARGAIQSEAAARLRDIFNPKTAGSRDLRDLVRGARADKGDLSKVLTLFWDDPERPPQPYEWDSNEGQQP